MFEVFLVPDASPYHICGACRSGVGMGIFLEYDSRCTQYSTMDAYFTSLGIPHHWRFKGSAGYSMREYTLDQAYHAVDLYIQPPDL